MTKLTATIGKYSLSFESIESTLKAFNETTDKTSLSLNVEFVNNEDGKIKTTSFKAETFTPENPLLFLYEELARRLAPPKIFFEICYEYSINKDSSLYLTNEVEAIPLGITFVKNNFIFTPYQMYLAHIMGFKQATYRQIQIES